MNEKKSNLSLMVGQQIKKIRKEKGITIEELAVSITKSASTVSKYENGAITIDVETFVELASGLDVEPRLLLEPVTTPLGMPSLQNAGAAKNFTSFFRNKLQPSRLFVYQYDGRLKRISKSLLHIMPDEDNHETEVTFYLDVPDFSKFNLCRYYYRGNMYSYDTIIYFSLANPFNPAGRIHIYTTNPYYLQHINDKINKFYGIFTGFSFRPFTPFSSKIILSPVVLQEDEELLADLMINKEDIKQIRKYNFLMLDAGF